MINFNNLSNSEKVRARLNDMIGSLSEERKQVLYSYLQETEAFGKRTETDLHIHSTNSDGKLTPKEILIISALVGLKNIAISDHDCVDAYLDPNLSMLAEDLNINMLPACEFVCICGNVPIEILGYGINVNLAKTYLDKFGITQKYLEFYRYDKVPKIFKSLGIDLKFDTSNIDLEAKDPRVLPALFEGILNDPAARKLCEDENPKLLENLNVFLRLGLNNPKSKFYMDMTQIYPSYKKIADLIHRLGGLAFLAHPYQYKNEMDNVLNTVKDCVDGIECYHFTSVYQNPEGASYLNDFCRKNHLMVSGGSDFHSPTNDGKGKLGNTGVPNAVYDRIFERLSEMENDKPQNQQ